MKRSNSMQERLPLLIAVAVLAVAIAGGDPAFAWDKKKSDEPADPRGKAVNLNLSPEMVITRGVLQIDAFGNWLLGERRLAFDKQTIVSDGEGEARLRSGYEAMVVGAPSGDALLVRSVTLIPPHKTIERGIAHMKAVPGEPNPASARIPQ